MINHIIELAVDYNELIIWLIIIFLLSIWIHPEEKNTQQIINNKNDDDNEYNFLATEESVPSQFDLAMAFISMKNFEQANAILKNLLNHPNLEISKKAEKMLNKISLNTKTAG